MKRKLTGKLMLHFVGQFLLVLLLVGIIFISTIVFFSLRLDQNEADTGLAKADTDSFEAWISDGGNGHLEVSNKPKTAVRKQKGWLQIIDGNQKTVYSYHLPNKIPNAYSRKDLLSIFEKGVYGKYKVSFWSVNIDNKSYIVLFGRQTESDRLFTYLDKKEKNLTSLSSFKKPTLQYMKEHKGSVYLFDKNGKFLDGINEQPKFKKKISELELLKYNSKPWEYAQQITYKRIDDARWMLVSVPNPFYKPDNEFDIGMFIFALKAFLIIIGVLLLMICLMTFWYSFRFGMPIIHTIKWLVNLSKGELEEPRNRKGFPVSKNKKGKVKRPYRLFTEVIESMDQLTHTLKKEKRDREKIQTTREEWIAGLSHDLKTPLSTVYGYSMMLESPQYEWSKEEVQEMGRAISEKSEYMSKLIEDLNLTYRLKNEALPIERKLVLLVPFLENIIEDFKKNPLFDGFTVSFSCENKQIAYPIDEGWFQRILENLLANAAKHNQKGTKIEVVLEETESLVKLEVKDDGKGMDEEMVANLFNRYYRGTNTKTAVEGTGLGLAITKELVHLHNGTIEVESDKDKGTVITMTFKKDREC